MTMMYVLIRGNLITKEKTIVETQRKEPYTKLANMLNYDHGLNSRKQTTPKKWIWFNKEVNPDG